MVRNIAAVLAGYAVTGLLVVCTDQLFAVFMPGFKSMAKPPTSYFAVSLVTDTVYSAVGGYLCAWTARVPTRTATLGLIIFGEIIGVVSTIVFWKSVPHWFGFGLLILYPPAVWFGSRLTRSTPATH
jgi:hypothetical protein